MSDKDGRLTDKDGRLSSDCTAVNDILSTIGDKWTVLIVVTLSKGPMRFNEIRRAVGGISQRMLTLTLARAGARRFCDPHRVPDGAAARRLRADRARQDADRAAHGDWHMGDRAPRGGGRRARQFRQCQGQPPRRIATADPHRGALTHVSACSGRNAAPTSDRTLRFSASSLSARLPQRILRSVKRDLAALADQDFDLAVIGGGVVGASIARDAARRGLSVALVERDDFAAATSEAMSHMVHGGIRYLAHAEFGQVRLSLAERAIWRRIAPHQVSSCRAWCRSPAVFRTSSPCARP